MKKNNAVLVIVSLIVLAAIAWVVFSYSRTDVDDTDTSGVATSSSVLSYEACVAAGYPLTAGTPARCTTPDGRVYAQEIKQNFTYLHASSGLIVVDNPYPGAVTGKQFAITGKARGTWYFEASFPYVVIDPNGKMLAQGHGSAQGDWMTTNFVPFRADVTIPNSYTGKATVLLKNDNPSGLPERDASVSFPITIEY